MQRILIVEDDKEIAILERDYLEINGFETEVIPDGQRALEAILKEHYDLVLLDLMLPGCDGCEICKQVRERVDIPILMVTARVESGDKIHGLELGADDYIAKPFDPAELVARVKAHLNRYARLTGGEREHAAEESVEIGPIQILPRRRKVYKNGVEIRFPNREFELLLFLAENPNVVFSRERLFEKIWGYEYAGDSATVTVHINRIREKIEDIPSEPVLIETVWGAGYRLNQTGTKEQR
jgi:DNA-binding response OmpR family regulator